MKNETTLYLRRVPKNIKDMFKGVCYRRNETMESVMAALMKFYIENPEKVVVRALTRNPPKEI